MSPKSRQRSLKLGIRHGEDFRRSPELSLKSKDPCPDLVLAEVVAVAQCRAEGWPFASPGRCCGRSLASVADKLLNRSRAPPPTTALPFDRPLVGVRLCYRCIDASTVGHATSLRKTVSDRPRRMLGRAQSTAFDPGLWIATNNSLPLRLDPRAPGPGD